MKVGVSGKGGTGKTTIAATLARLAARRGYDTLAIDCDTNPNLGVSLGLGYAAVDGAVPLPPSRDLDEPLSARRLVTEHGVAAGDGVTLVIAARVDEAAVGWKCGELATVRGLLGDVLSAEHQLTVADMEAGLEHLTRSEGTLRHVDALVVVLEPYHKAIHTARRTVAIARDLGIPHLYAVASKVQDLDEEAELREVAVQLGVPLLAVVPFDDAVRRADRDGTAVLDVAPESEAVAGIGRLLDALEEELALRAQCA